MDYYSKYLKYKKKYLELENQKAGFLKVFDSGDTHLKVAAYIFTRSSTDGQFLFGCVRKLYNGGRVCGSRGAAGTDRKYWGKWTSIGGTRSPRSTSHLDAIIRELNDETNSKFATGEVDLTLLNSRLTKPATTKLTCHLAEEVSGVAVFIFEMKELDFLRIFPIAGVESPAIFRSSHGELDAIKAFTMGEIFEMQEKEIKDKANNYFISYFLTNLVNKCIPIISDLNEIFKKKWIGKTITTLPDAIDRVPTEFQHIAYRK
jgi:hypothetical protein